MHLCVFSCDDHVMAFSRVLLACMTLVHVDASTRAFLDLLKESDVTDDVISFNRYGTSRPAPSDKLPVIDLIENPSTAFDPPPSELNHRKLRRLLGDDFDPEYMGIGRPIISVFQPNGTVTLNRRRGRPKEKRPDFIKDIGSPVRYDSHLRTPGLNVNRRIKRTVKKYIWNYTHCPVVYAWKDLGIRFWPQWIKEGTCHNGRSCSIPPGMMCRPAASETRTLFRWHCPRNSKGKVKCRWIRIQYPIITKCSCSC